MREWVDSVLIFAIFVVDLLMWFAMQRQAELTRLQGKILHRRRRRKGRETSGNK